MTNAKKHAAIVTPVLDLVEKEDGKTAWTLTRSASEDDSTRYCLPNFCRFLVAFASTLLLLNVILPDLPSTNCGQMFSKRLTSACLYRAGSIALVALFCGLGAYKFRRWRCLLALGGATLPSWRGRGLLLALALSLVVPRNAHVVLVNIRRGEAYFQCRLTELERAGTGVGRTIDPLASKANRHALPEGEDEEERMFWSTFAKTPYASRLRHPVNLTLVHEAAQSDIESARVRLYGLYRLFQPWLRALALCASSLRYLIFLMPIFTFTLFCFRVARYQSRWLSSAYFDNHLVDATIRRLDRQRQQPILAGSAHRWRDVRQARPTTREMLTAVWQFSAIFPVSLAIYLTCFSADVSREILRALVHDESQSNYCHGNGGDAIFRLYRMPRCMIAASDACRAAAVEIEGADRSRIVECALILALVGVGALVAPLLLRVRSRVCAYFYPKRDEERAEHFLAELARKRKTMRVTVPPK